MLDDAQCSSCIYLGPKHFIKSNIVSFKEFLTNRNAAKMSLNQIPSTNPTQIPNEVIKDFQVIGEEPLKVKTREAESQSEMKYLYLKIMQLETEVKFKS